MRTTFRRFIPSHILTLALFFFLSSSNLGAQSQPQLAPNPPNRASWSHLQKYKQNEILVRFRPGVPQDRKNLLHAALRAEQVKSWSAVDGLHLVRLPATISIKDAVKAYKQSPDVLYAEPNYSLHALTVPNDPKFPQLWGLQNTGQFGGTPGADIHASQAWSLSTGSSNVVVAVIDTGMDYSHEDLAPNVWSSSAAYSVSVNGVVINCPAGSHGFNAVAGTCDPMDDNGHGTHVSGTIGAAGNNGVGVAGINWSVRIMPCKFLDAYGGGFVDAAVTCLDFVKSMKDRGEKVIATNNSWGGGGFSQALFDAIKSQQLDGILFVAAAGNDSADNDLGGFYPAGFFLPNVISVAATTRFDWLANFSDTGRHTVSLGAPGQEIFSTFPNNSYAWLNGTSMAAPHVTGAAALLAAQDPSRDWRAIKNLLMAGGDTIPALSETISGKRLNVYGSMTCSNSTVARKLQPTLDTIVGTSGTPILLAALNINCAQPAGPVTVNVTPGNQTITLLDNASGQDQAAQDGIYSAQWIPPGIGNYQLTFSTGDTVQVTVLNNYVAGETGYNYQTITGTNLNLGDDEVATINLPFSVQYGGAAFSRLYVSSNGTISFTNPFYDFLNFAIPVNAIENTNPANPPPPDLLQPVVTLIAPLWMDLYPVKGTNQNVFWSVTGTAPNRQIVVEWRNVLSFACRADTNATVTFQAIFSESTSDVLFNYANAAFGGDCANEDDAQAASIGLQVSQNLGLQWGGPSVPLYIPGHGGIQQPTIAGGMALLWTLVDPSTPPNPAPTVTSVSPASVLAGSPDTWVTLTGAGFLPSSQAFVYPIWTRVTKYISSTQVQVLLTAADLAYPISWQGLQINVTNPPPGGGTSQPVYLQVSAQNPNPAITSLSPGSVPAGSFGFILTVNGSGFVPGATNVLFDGNGGQTTFVSATQLTFAVTGAMVQTARTANVQVQTGPGTISNVVPFTITSATAPATLQAPISAAGSGAQKNGANGKPHALPLPGRFLGWKAAQALGLGSEYFDRYKRPVGRLAPAPPTGSSFANSLAAPLTTNAIAPAPAGLNVRPTLPAGFIPTAVVSGDFNGDGKLDWAVANGGDNTIWIYLGNGDGTAQLPRIVRLMGYAPVALAAADMNGDGKLDLVVAEVDSLAVAVLLGNGDGTFAPEFTFTVPGYPESLTVADFNGDGKLDVVVGLAVAEAEIAFLPGDGTGRLGTPVLHYGQGDGLCIPFAVAVADLNKDGFPDVVALDFSLSISGVLITSQMGNAGARVYLNQGDGSFKLSQQFFHDSSVDQGPQDGEAVTAVALGDVNGDGCPDAVALDSLGTATFFPGLCDGTFDIPNKRIFGAGIVASAAALADLNGDGKLDLISSSMPFLNDALYASTPANSLSVQFGDGSGSFGAPTLFRGEPQMVSLTVADLRRNGRPEIITANQQTDSITVYKNSGTGDFGSPKGGYAGYLANGQMHAVGNAPLTNFALLDLNGDGLPDLATIETGEQFPLPVKMTVMLNNGAGGFGPPLRSPVLDVYNDISDFFLADFRNTGRKDLLLFSFYLPYGSQFGPSFGFAQSNGDGTFQKPVWTGLQSSGIWPVRFALGDFNQDGKLDFLILSYASATSGTGTVAGIYLYLGNGDGTFTPLTPLTFPSTSTYAPYFGQVVVADVNGDGKSDLLVLGYQLFSATEQNAIYEFIGNGDGTFQAAKLLFNNLGPFAAADLNKDGRTDIVAAVDQGMNAGVFGHAWVYQVFTGNGDGSFSPGQTYGPYPNPYAAGYLYPPADHPLGAPQPVLGDFNGDGVPDLAVYSTAGTNVFNEIGYAGAPLNTQVFILAGNGDGSFSVPNVGLSLGGLIVPQTAGDLNRDGRTDLLEMNAYTSAYTYLTAASGASFAVGLVSDPVIGANGKLRIILTYPSANATTLQLSVSDPNISIPASVTIPGGSNFQDVSFQIGAAFNSSKVFGLSAQLGTETHIAYGTQAPPGQNTGFIAAFQFPTIPVVVAGQTTPDFGLLAASVGGYATQITVSCQGLPAGSSCQIQPNPASLPAGGEIAISLVVATQPGLAPGHYPFTVNLTDGVVSVNLSAAFNVGDFAMSLAPAAQTLGSTDFTSFTLNVQSINGYSQAVQVTCTTLPVGVSCPFNGPVFPGANYFQLHTQNTPNGTYTFTLTGTSSGITRTASAQLTVTSGTFAGSVSPASATISVGGSQNFSVQVNSSGGFQGQVNLSCYTASGLSCQMNPPQVTLAAAGTATASLVIQVNSKPATVPWSFPRISRRLGTKYLFALALVLLLAFLLNGGARRLRGQDLISTSTRRWSYQIVFLLLLYAVFSMSSCGGGGTTGGGGGNGGGGAGFTVTSVNVQGSAGGTTVTLGSVTVTIPR